MRRRAVVAGALALAMGAGSGVAQTQRGGVDGSDGFDFAFRSIDGGDLPLAPWRGRPVLVVNTASFCGFTPQYADLEALWRRYGGEGLVVLGVPSNDFGGQEPGSAAEIKDFCESRFDIGFPLAEKERVVGPQAHPFYRWALSAPGAAPPRWNFHKYLLGPDGRIAGSWGSEVKPTGREITAAIEKALAARSAAPKS